MLLELREIVFPMIKVSVYLQSGGNFMYSNVPAYGYVLIISPIAQVNTPGHRISS